MVESDESRIERLKRTLYSRNENIVPREKRTPVSPQEFDVPKTWGDKPNYDISPEIIVKRNNSFFNKYLIGSIVFFLISVGVALFIFYGGINMISSNNLNVEVVAPTSISSGEELSIGLSVINGNRTDLEEVTLFVDYPDGTYSIVEENRLITHDEIKLGTVEKSGTIEHSIRALLFGEKDAVKSFTFRIEYKVKGSNAVFSKEKIYDVIIGSSPILLEVKYPKEVNSGQNITISIEVTSNSSVPLKDTLIKVEYPYGFTYKSSSLTPVRDNSVWSIGDLKNGDRKDIDIVGVLVGQNLEDRSFRVSAGTKTGSIYDFDTTLVSTLVTMGIRKSFFDLAITTGSEGVMKTGQSTSVGIKWQNTLPDKIVNSKIEVKLSGTALDRSMVNVSNNGFYRSIDDTIIWDKNSTESLVEMSPGDFNQVNFSVGSLANLVQPKLVKNPHIDLKVVMSGERTGRDSSTVSSTEDLVIKLSSQATLTSKSYRNTGPFTNGGPIPPKADQESTYTIGWTITNTTNDLKDTIVRTTLPPGVSWKGEVSPGSEKVNYDPDSRVVTWDIGNVAAGTGFVYSPKQVYFKVGLIPSVSQIGSSPSLTSVSNVFATDTYTDKQIDSSAAYVTTKHSDPSFSNIQEAVVQ